MVGVKRRAGRLIGCGCSLLALLFFDQRAFAAPRLTVGPLLTVDEAPVPTPADFGGAAFDGTHWLVILDEPQPAATWLAADGSRTGAPFPILDASVSRHHLVFDGQHFVLASFRALASGSVRQELNRFDGTNFGPAIVGVQEEVAGDQYPRLKAHDLALAPDGSVWTVACTDLPAASTSDCTVAVLDGDALVPHATISLAYDLQTVELEPNGNGALLFTESLYGGVRAYRLAADGTFADPIEIAADGSFQARTTLSAARSAGGYAVAWAGDRHLGLARLDGNGQVVATKLGTATSVEAPTLGAAPDGYVLALAQGEPWSYDLSVHIQALDAELTPRGSAVQFTDRSQFRIGLSAAQPGVMVAWSSTQSEALRASVLDPTSLAPQGPVPVDLSFRERDQRSLLAARAGHSWLVAWMDVPSDVPQVFGGRHHAIPHGLRARLFDDTLSARGDSFALPASTAPSQLVGSATGWLLNLSMYDSSPADPIHEALLVSLDGTASEPFILPGPTSFAPLEDGWLALSTDKQLVVDRYDQRGVRLSRSVVAETTDSRQAFESFWLVKTEDGFVAVWNARTQLDPLLEREVGIRRLDVRGEPVGAAENVGHDWADGPRATSVAATSDAVWLLLDRNRMEYGTYFTPFPLTEPLQRLTAERFMFAKLQAASGYALGAWNIPGEDRSPIGLAEPGAAWIKQAELPLTLSDISAPMLDAENPREATLVVAGTVTSRGLGTRTALGRIALLRVGDDGDAAGGAPGQPMAGEAGQRTAGEAGQRTAGDGGESTAAGDGGQPPPGAGGQPATDSGGENAGPGAVPTGNEHGCGCHMADSPGGDAAAWSLLMLVGALGRRRRRTGSAAYKVA